MAERCSGVRPRPSKFLLKDFLFALGLVEICKGGYYYNYVTPSRITRNKETTLKPGVDKLTVKRIRGVLTARLVGAALVLWPLAGYPLGLGKLKVLSALNEPLSAEIEFTSIADAERKGLNATLASRAEFEAAGAQQLPFLSQIKFTVTKRPDGRYFLQLKTDQAVEEPFLHLLLQVEWPGGRLVREYTALIDPPQFVEGKPLGIETPSTAAVKPAPATPNESPAPAPATPASEMVATPEPPSAVPEVVEPPVAPPQPAAAPPVEPLADPKVDVAVSSEAQDSDAPKVAPLDAAPSEQAAPASGAISSSAVPSGDHPVKPGDTLWAIAERARGDNQISVQQMAIAIYRQNRDAFYRNNINNLRAGKVLKMPEREAATAIAIADARREFKVQYDVWQEYKLKVASASRGLTVPDSAPASAPAAAPDPAPAAAPAVTPPPPAAPATREARAVAPPEERSKQPEELLRIVRGALETQKISAANKGAQVESPKETEKKERSALAERVTTFEESLESKQLEQKELGEKLGTVRSQIKNETRLLELENPNMAKVQAQAAPAAPASKPEPTPAPKEASAPERAAAPAAPASEPAKVEKPIKKPVVVPPPVPAEKDLLTSLLDDFRDGSLLPIVGGGLVLVGGAVLLLYMRRRRRSIAEFEESILASDAVTSDSNATTDTTGQAVTTGDTSFLSDFSQGGMGHVHTDEVDPIAEAEVYLAYGRDETAEEILKEAIVKNPERQELKLKLLEIYHQRNDVGAFETLAEELYAALAGRGGKIWDKVEEMGRRLNPDNPMFRGGAPAARRAGDQPVATAPVAAAAGAAVVADSGFATQMVSMSPENAPTQVVSGIDFDFEVNAAASGGAADLDFNTSSAASTPAHSPAAFAAAAGNHESDALELGESANGNDSMMEFVDMDKKGIADVAVNLASPNETADAADDIKWESDTLVDTAADELSSAVTGDGATQQWDETATKLDLAKAYIDMGDAEGARSILDEVLAEGNEDQKKQAAQLASQIA